MVWNSQDIIKENKCCTANGWSPGDSLFHTHRVICLFIVITNITVAGESLAYCPYIPLYTYI